MVAPPDEPDDPLEALLRLGERQGYLTYEMINERLPDEVVSAEKLDTFIAEIDRLGIRLIDEADAPPRSGFAPQ
jgi:RNA polymerase primary sigma factor